MDSKSGPRQALTVTICGGGNGAHMCVAYLGSKAGLRVRVFTRKPQLWSSTVTAETKGSSWEDKPNFVGTLSRVSDDASQVIPGSDIVLVCAPANAHLPIVSAIAPFISKNTWLGALYGQGGFDWAATSAFHGDWSKLDALFGFQNIPWLCRTIRYGDRVQLIGPKKELWVACWPPNKGRDIAKGMSLLFDIPTVAVDNFLSLTLSPSNQIIHPGRLVALASCASPHDLFLFGRYYGIFHKWDGQTPFTAEAVQWGLYTEMDELSAQWMQRLDEELQAIRVGLVRRFPELDLSRVLPLGERILYQYGEDVKNPSTLQTIFATNKGYAGCVTPTQRVPGGFIPAVNSRLFWEDVPFGLCVLKGVAEILGLKTPSIDYMIEWHQQFMNKRYLVNGKLNTDSLAETAAPQAYGIHSLDDLVRPSLPAVSPLQPAPREGLGHAVSYQMTAAEKRRAKL